LLQYRKCLIKRGNLHRGLDSKCCVILAQKRVVAWPTFLTHPPASRELKPDGTTL
jgi:hypothetical protein